MVPRQVTPRRRDRSKDEAWIRTVLDRVVWGTLAVEANGGPPYVNTNLFVRAGDRLYLHTAAHGGLVDLVARDGDEGRPATFTAAVFGRLLPAPTALEFSVEYAAVVASGLLTRVDDEGEATAALHALLERYAPDLQRGVDYREVVPSELARTAVFRFDIDSWSGKEKAVGSHEGAITLRDPAPPVL